MQVLTRKIVRNKLRKEVGNKGLHMAFNRYQNKRVTVNGLSGSTENRGLNYSMRGEVRA